MTEQELIEALVTDFNWGHVDVQLGLRSNFRCEYCDRDLLASVEEYDTWQRDHIVPRSRGGSETEFDNLAIACKPCNFFKRHWEPSNSSDIPFERAKRIALARDFIAERRKRKHNDLDRMHQLITAFNSSKAETLGPV